MKYQNMMFWKRNKNLGDIQWIFAKTDNISDLQTLKAKVIAALKTADGKPIKELEKLFENKSFGDKIKVWMDTKKEIKSDSFLGWLDNSDNFYKFFKIAD